MLFNSPAFFLVFLPVVLLGFFLLGLRTHRGALAWLAAASLFFYGWWDVRFVGLLLVSIGFNYGGGLLLRRAGRHSGRLLALLVAANLALLAYCKYRGFFLDTWHFLWGLPPAFGAVVLPLGISFFTFTQIAFLVDTFRGEAREHHFLHYLLFVSYFPHLIAGPIIHHAQVMPQFDRGTACRWDWENAGTGLTLFVLGLGKKMFLADGLVPYVGPAFAQAAGGACPVFADAWGSALAYALQLYFDFSGYSDMAVGLSLLFNVRLPLNFNSPYKAASIIDFWRRWHMTLSAFLRDYLYIPLGGNRRGLPRRYGNVALTMLLGGLWHGANWTFVAWGGLHGLCLMLNHGFRDLCGRLGWREGRFGAAGRGLSFAATFLAVVVAWVFFRASDLASAGRMLAGMAGAGGFSFSSRFAADHPSWVAFLSSHGVACSRPHLHYGEGRDLLPPLLLGLAIVWLLPNTQQWLRRAAAFRGEAPGRWPEWRPARWWAWGGVGILLAIEVAHLGKQGVSEFLYYRF